MSVTPSDFLTVGLLVILEGLLSADNAMVLAVLVLGLPKEQQRKALRYGIVGAFAFRTLATIFAAQMIQLRIVQLIGGLYWCGCRTSISSAAATPRSGGSRCKRGPGWDLSAFWATVVKVELTDIVFAIDSILVAVAMSPKLWVVMTGGILGIVAMRMVIGQLLVDRPPLPGDRRRCVRDHRVGRDQAARRMGAQLRLDRRCHPEVAFAVADRGHLHRVVALRTAPRRRHRR